MFNTGTPFYIKFCREFRTNEKVDIFNFALCLESENERDDIL